MKNNKIESSIKIFYKIFYKKKTAVLTFNHFFIHLDNLTTSLFIFSDLFHSSSNSP